MLINLSEKISTILVSYQSDFGTLSMKIIGNPKKLRRIQVSRNKSSGGISTMRLLSALAF